MSRLLVPFLVLGEVTFLSAFQPQQDQGKTPSYSAGFYTGRIDSGGGGLGLQSLVVFPFVGEAYSIALPFAIGYFAHTPDGEVLYANADYADMFKGLRGAPDRPGVFRFELNSMRPSLVPGSAEIEVFGLAVSRRQDKLLVSGQVRSDRRLTCGLFEVSLPGGATRNVMEIKDCDYRSAWREPSLSPDGEYAVAVRGGSLELFDLKSRKVRSLGNNFVRGSWSPDGDWIAAIRTTGETIVMDTGTFVTRRTLADTNGDWSPDSRYLLGTTSAGCGNEFVTLQAVDVTTGARRTITSSVCKINSATTAWVNVERP